MTKYYSFSDHLHNYAVWTAARAVQRSFTTTQNIKTAINESVLRQTSELLPWETSTDFEQFHRRCANRLINSFLELGIRSEKCTYGRAAKIIAIYLKTSVVIPYIQREKIVGLIHPPIDRVLLSNLSRKNKIADLTKIGWTSLNETNYWELCGKIEKSGFALNWTLEEYWHPEQEYYSDGL